MIDTLKTLFKQPYWIIALVLGFVLVIVSCFTIDKDYRWQSQPPHILPAAIGIGLLLLSIAAFSYTLWTNHKTSSEDVGKGLDLSRVKENNGAMSTMVSGCEIRVVTGRIEDYTLDSATAIVLPCNEYYDDRCAGDSKSALGAYVNRVFENQVEEFISLLLEECRRKLGPGREQQKTDDERAISFGAGKSLLLLKPLGRSVPVAVMSTTTQRAGEGLAARISYLFEGMRDLVNRLADARVNEIVMPILGAGHGRIDPPLALVGLLLAVAEAARYGQGGQHLRKATIVVFKRDENTAAQVDAVVIRRALALIGAQG